ncbi:unnamed protein product [Microthlaspi erraticum]|uniref:Integrase catalytic domain-containing protein n=1 Tax=Microthlaspi erraticum TaxID=1685480 RepID=A0A6D2KKN5_9BRAS|nr:unnamed protein product [Microthlaspi erraticum]
METLARKGYMKKDEVSNLGFCEACTMGKAHKQSFPKAKHTTKAILEYVHSDLWGSPSVTPSLSDSKYFITFIDDFSKKILVENQTGKKLKCLRTDNGLEFCNNQFDKLCRESGVKRHKTCPYTPQQNGVSKRMNRSIMDKVRRMLTETGLNGEFWAEAASTAVYIINRSPSASIDFEVPEALWIGDKPSYNHLRTFGCMAYVHTINDKISPRATKVKMLCSTRRVCLRIWVSEQNQEAEISRVQKKKKTVTFSNDLVQVREESEDTEETPSSGGVDSSVVPTDTEEESSSSSSSSSSGLSSDKDEDNIELNDQPGNLDNYLLARDRERRVRRPPSMFEGTDFVAYALASAEAIELDEPRTYFEALKSKDGKRWVSASDEEMDSLRRNYTWILVERPKDQKVIGCKWIFKLKPGIPEVELPRYKARLVAKGYAQIEGIDYNEVFAPVVKHTSIRLLLSLVVNQDMELEQLDVKTAFLHGILHEKIYMDQPEGYVEKGQEDKVCLLKRSLYGLKQSPREWNHRFDSFMINKNYKKSEYDPCVYLKGDSNENMVYLLLYVDDMLIASKSMKIIKELKEILSSEFEMKD